MRRFLLVITALCVMVWGAVAYVIVEPRIQTGEPLPTLMVLPSLTPSASFTATASATATWTASSTSTPPHTATPTATRRATATPTLSERVIYIEAVMPGVVVPPTQTPLPDGVLLIPAPPQPFEPLPDATDQPPPYMGWISYESDHPAVRYSTPWDPRLHSGASRGQYHRTDDPNSGMSMAFDGEGLRIRYVAARNMGMFEVIVDDVIIDTVDAYSPELAFAGTRVYSVGTGAHVLTVRGKLERNPRSEGSAVALDAVQVYRTDHNTLIVAPPLQTQPPTEEPRPVARIELVSAPPTVQPTPTPIPLAELNISVVIAYDENGNRAVDPAEGVSGIPVRVVETGTNRVISHAFTDSSGYTRLQIVTDSPTRVVVPYFGKVWEVPNSRRRGNLRFTHLLTPGNQPGLIP